MFLSSLTNSDRLNFVVFGSGTVHIDFLSQRCTHNRVAISPLFYCVAFREWLEKQLLSHGSTMSAVDGAELTVEVIVETYRNSKGGIPGWLSTRMDLRCTSRVAINGREYQSSSAEVQERGLGQILHGHQY
jgi:hypothetical protein